MATDAQVRANRLNAQRSTGPRTAAGKAQVSQNAVKHGLLAREGVIRGESREEYEIHREMLMEELDPIGPLEVILASRVVDLTWRLHRAGQDRNEIFGALYDRYIARKGSAGAVTGHGADGAAHPAGRAAGAMASDRGLEVWDTRGQDARGTQEPEALATDGEEALDTGTAAGGGATLGRMILEDFEQDAVLDRLLRYERRIESSLFRTLRELRGMHEQNRPTDREVADTVQRWREEDREAKKARMLAFARPPDGPPEPVDGTTDPPWTEVPHASETPSSPSATPTPDSSREDEICETNPIGPVEEPPAGPEDQPCETNPISERVSSWKGQAASESCETNPIEPRPPGRGRRTSCAKQTQFGLPDGLCVPGGTV